ncbi:L,D-transpeptidase family protein [Halomonas sp. Bachu 37]|uniref:L,D-transpeptidase family protein n=1 Tax=Halomonas kashgarensis TaxID=3084920 RepID=UPI003216DAFF
MNRSDFISSMRPITLAVMLAVGVGSSSTVLAEEMAGPSEASSAETAGDEGIESTGTLDEVSDEAVESASQVMSPNGLPRGNFHLSEDSDVIGQHYTVTVKGEKETLIDIARRHNIGYEEIRMANPDVSLWVPGKGTEVVIPAQYLLPPGPREGVVVNLSELRLYYYPADKPGIVETYPVSVGREEFATPRGKTKTTIKVKDPAWSPPASMRREAAERGDPPPAIVPPGPENPLGRHAILLDISGYLIHGTNRPDGVGMRVSRGCIRMYPEDIESLYERLPSGTQVNLIDAPFKAGWSEDGELYGQSFPQLEENQGNFEPIINALDTLAQATEDANVDVDYARVRRMVEHPDGSIVALANHGEAHQESPPEAEDEEGLYSDLEVSALVIEQ